MPCTRCGARRVLPTGECALCGHRDVDACEGCRCAPVAVLVLVLGERFAVCTSCALVTTPDESLSAVLS